MIFLQPSWRSQIFAPDPGLLWDMWKWSIVCLLRVDFLHQSPNDCTRTSSWSGHLAMYKNVFSKSRAKKIRIAFRCLVSRWHATHPAQLTCYTHPLLYCTVTTSVIFMSWNCSNCGSIIFVSPELSSVRDYVITHSVRSMYVCVCMWHFAKLMTVSTYIDELSWDLDTMILG